MKNPLENTIGAPYIAVIGLGYVGLPLAIEFAKKFPVIGFDVSQEKVSQLKECIDYTNEVTPDTLKTCSAQFTDNPTELQKANIFIVTVPTPIDPSNKPDLSAIKSASKTVGKALKKGTIVVYESTVYPGVSEDVCVPILEKESGLKFNEGFFLGYSPERISPGDKERTLTKIMKIVSGSTPAILEFLTSLYGAIITAGIYQASSIKVAEAAKAIENTQRDLNIALMNELSIIFNKLGISTLDVIEAASTKWNFMKMSPGLVGGHCIGVDPYYLTYQAQLNGYYPRVILSGRRINDSMGKYIAEQTVKLLIKNKKIVSNASVLVLGFAFKENVPDVRNTKVIDVINELNEYGISPTIVDAYANREEAKHEYGISIQKQIPLNQKYDAIILTVPHTAYITPEFLVQLKSLSDNPRALIDVKGIFRHAPNIQTDFTYWSL